MVLVRLDELVVGSLAGRGPVVAVELEVSLVEGGGVFANVGAIDLLDPDDFLDGVVEVKLNLGLGLFLAGELQLLDEVLVGDLSESAPFIGIEINIVDVEGGGVESLRGAGDARGARCKFDDKFDLMILKSNKWKGEAGVAAEPELQGNVEDAGRAVGR